MQTEECCVTFLFLIINFILKHQLLLYLLTISLHIKNILDLYFKSAFNSVYFSKWPSEKNEHESNASELNWGNS